MYLEQRAAYTSKLLPFLRRELGLSSGLIKRLKWQNAFLVDGLPVHTDALIQAGQTVRVVIEEAVEGFPAEDLPLQILLETDDFLAVDKPCGMLIHPSPHKNTGTLANSVLGYYQRTGQHSGIHPLTRLDRDTFGVVIFAKNAYIQEKFKQIPIQKFYIAPVFGHPAVPCGTIDFPIGRVPSPADAPKSLLRRVDPAGKPSLTRYRELSRQGEISILELEAVTGRTHQLRVHCLASGFPILGDPQYYSAASLAYSSAHGLFTQQLCAKRVCFALGGAAYNIESRQTIRTNETTAP